MFENPSKIVKINQKSRSFLIFLEHFWTFLSKIKIFLDLFQSNSNFAIEIGYVARMENPTTNLNGKSDKNPIRLQFFSKSKPKSN